MVHRSLPLLVVDRDRRAEGVETEKVEWKTFLERDMLQSVAVVPGGKEQKGDDHRVCQS
jgi:hypothetical protein